MLTVYTEQACHLMTEELLSVEVRSGGLCNCEHLFEESLRVCGKLTLA
jgi:hypothetical protein